MQLLSNELKAVAVITDMTEQGVSVTRDQCMTVDHFDYRCVRKRDSVGRTYGATNPVELSFSVRINTAEQAQTLYQYIASDEPGVLSFLFNATFSDTKRLSGYDEAMAVEGFVVDIKEDFQSAVTEQIEEQVILRARMHVRSIIYLRQDEQKTLCFIHD